MPNTSPEQPRYGAHPADWNQLEFGCDLTEDLLPVVSNPNATIAPESLLKGLGKTPSKYNSEGKVVGFGKWTAYQATAANLKRWSAQPDYGICIQTRRVRALDIDIADRTMAATVLTIIEDFLQRRLPMRYRANSGKCLLAFRLEGEFAKRILRTEHGNIEFLANGQQFVAYGTHTTGARLEWDWKGEVDFPTLTAEEFEALWAHLVDVLGAGESTTLRYTERRRGADLDYDDPIVAQLDVLGEGNDGQLYIDCPWKDGHTSDTGIGQTCYFPAGTGGYQAGHFKCLHAGCQKSDQEFMDALGLRCEYAETAELAVTVNRDPGFGENETDFDEELPEALPPLTRDKHGKADATVLNVTAMLEAPKVVGLYLRLDTFRDEIMYAPLDEPGSWRQFTDDHYTTLRRLFDRMNFKPVGRELMRDCVSLVARENKFDSAVEWLGGLEWDGVPRVGGFMARYLGTGESEYATAVSYYLWTALAGRCLVPGIKADMAPILVGDQNLGKSLAIQTMAPAPDYFVEVDLSNRDENNARLMRGCLVGELAELKGLASRELEAIKAFMTRTHEKWTPKYKEFASTYARRLIFVGTSNADEFLADETGNRRWLPIRVTKADIDGIARDREQLWAEARELFKAGGIQYQAAHRLGQLEHAAYMITDAWADAIEEWLELPVDDLDGGGMVDGEPERTNRQGGPYRVLDVARGALALDPRTLRKADEMRIGKILRASGWVRQCIRIGGKPMKVWQPQGVTTS